MAEPYEIVIERTGTNVTLTVTRTAGAIPTKLSEFTNDLTREDMPGLKLADSPEFANTQITTLKSISNSGILSNIQSQYLGADDKSVLSFIQELLNKTYNNNIIAEYDGTLDGNNLVDISGNGNDAIYVSGAGLDKIYDLTALGLSFNKNAYVGNAFNLPAIFKATYPTEIYFDTNNPYHWKLKDFHYRIYQNQINRGGNNAFAKITYTGSAISSVDSLSLFKSPQTLSFLDYLREIVIGVYPTLNFLNTNYLTFLRTNFGKIHTIEFETFGINETLTFQTILGDVEYGATGIIDRFTYMGLTGDSLRYQVQDSLGTVQAFANSGDAALYAKWKIERNGTAVNLYKDDVLLGARTLGADKDLWIDLIGAVKNTGILDAGLIHRIKIWDSTNTLIIDWAAFSEHAAYDISGNNFHASNSGVNVVYDYKSPVNTFKNVTKNTANIICKGDSLTLGLGAYTGQSYPDQLGLVFKCKELLDSTITNKGVSGQRLSTMITNAPAEIDSLFVAGVTDTLIFWGGANDLLDQDTSANIYAKIKQYCQARKAVGWKVFVCELLDANSAPNWAVKRNEINALMNSDLVASGYIDGVVRLSLNPKIGYDGAQNDTVYFGDGLHLTVKGYYEVAYEAYNYTKNDLTLLATTTKLRVPASINVIGYNNIT